MTYRGYHIHNRNHQLSLVQFAKGQSLDAFDRLRISQPKTIFDSKQIYDNQALLWDDAETSGSGTSSSHSTDTATTTISVSASTAGTRIRQTKRFFNYQPGKSQLIIMTGRVINPGTGITQRSGYYDDNNGIFFESKDGVLNAVLRSSVTGSAVDTQVPQSQWNIDRLDGTDHSGVNIDPTKVQLYFFDFSWLGTNIARWGFIVDGKILYCHEGDYGNRLTTPYMSSPNLPLRYEVSNDGTGGAASVDHICSTVISEGGDNEHGIIRHFGTENTSVTLKAQHLYPKN
jgi:hypothetical protein